MSYDDQNVVEGIISKLFELQELSKTEARLARIREELSGRTAQSKQVGELETKQTGIREDLHEMPIRNKQVGELETKQTGIGEDLQEMPIRNKQVGELETKQTGIGEDLQEMPSRNKQVGELETKQTGIGEDLQEMPIRNKQVGELETKQTGIGEDLHEMPTRNKQVGELETKQTGSREDLHEMPIRNKQVGELETKQTGIGEDLHEMPIRNKQVGELETKQTGIGEDLHEMPTRNKQVGELETKQTGIGEDLHEMPSRKKQVGELETKQTCIRKDLHEMPTRNKQVGELETKQTGIGEDLHEMPTRNKQVGALKTRQTGIREDLHEMTAGTRNKQEATSKTRHTERSMKKNWISAYGILTSHEDEDVLTEYEFHRFAAAHFQNGENEDCVRRPLTASLLPHHNKGDQMAALVVWVTILRFMGDLPEPKYRTPTSETEGTIPIMKRISSTLKNRYNFNDVRRVSTDIVRRVEASSVNFPLSRRQSQDSRHNKLMTYLMKEGGTTTRELAEIESLTYHRQLSSIHKVHQIIGNAIARPNLRDEIYCQICKQLTKNPSHTSRTRGWTLMALCLGCFLPSKEFLEYLRCFIHEGPPDYASDCEERLRRTMTNGPRNQPPTWVELQAVERGTTILLPITTMDGNTKILPADSATTARELCQQLAEIIGLKDRFGFSLYCAIFDQVFSSGSGGNHVMDAIFLCEQYSLEKGAYEHNAPWRLYLRKEVFAPCHNPAADSIATNLIYEQIIRGISVGEYGCVSEGDLVILMAQLYLIENGSTGNKGSMHTFLSSCLPKSSLNSKPLDYWVEKVRRELEGSYFTEGLPTGSVKEDIVLSAMHRWPRSFSRRFPADTFTSVTLSKNGVVLGLNSAGVIVSDDQGRLVLELPFSDLNPDTCSRFV